MVIFSAGTCIKSKFAPTCSLIKSILKIRRKGIVRRESL
jgi:hypothetical protein